MNTHYYRLHLCRTFNSFYLFTLYILIFIVVIKEGKTIAKEEDTVYLEGYVQNHHSVKNFNWQKYRNGKFYHIDVHKSKYTGTTTNLPNSKLVLNDIDGQDGGEYRIEVQRTEGVDYSNVYGLMILPRDGKPNSITMKYFCILVQNKTSNIKQTCYMYKIESEVVTEELSLKSYAIDYAGLTDET